MYERFGKRIVDVLLSLFALITLTPVFAAIATAIRLEDGPPVLFRQERVGKDTKGFEFLKFRSMPVDTPHLESRNAGTLAITKVGRLTRRTNLDEVPQLFNILKGEMSIVGPRPPLPTQTDVIGMRALNGSLGLRPGLTGLAQINAYEGMPPEEKAQWDGVYAANLSPSLDLSIILRTFRYLAKPPPSY
jgi:O-antigen biosynthesis protein WbqP